MVSAAKKNYKEQTAKITSFLEKSGLGEGHLHAAVTNTLTAATDGTLHWTGFTLDAAESQAVFDKALILYRNDMQSLQQMEQDGVSTVARLKKPFSFFPARPRTPPCRCPSKTLNPHET